MSDAKSGPSETVGPAEAVGPAETVGLPHIYTNGFQIALTNADVNLVLKVDNQPTHVVRMSFTLAKTLHQKMGATILKFEKATGRKMLVTTDVDEAFGAPPTKKRRTKKKVGNKT